jgi:hypothetical protein
MMFLLARPLVVASPDARLAVQADRVPVHEERSAMAPDV